MDADLQVEVRSSDGLCRSKKRAPDGVTVAEFFYAKTQTLVGYTFSFSTISVAPCENKFRYHIPILRDSDLCVRSAARLRACCFIRRSLTGINAAIVTYV
jgi:hypothetical protein